MVSPLRWLCPLLATTLLFTAGAMAVELDPQWLDRVSPLYDGPTATALQQLTAYTGEAAAERILGEDRRRAYLLNYRQLGLNYGDNVDYRLRQEQVILCPQTVELLYGSFTPLQTRYQAGSRPELERIVAGATASCAMETDRALALMRFCRDLVRTDPDLDFGRYVYGGTEEQLIAKPDILCETLGRLMVALCEVAGIPGRLVMHDIGGHICAEVYVDGGWAYIDPRCGVHFRKADGKLASVLELCQDPGIIDRQPDEVKAEVGYQWSWEQRAHKCRAMYFDPREVNGFENYGLADADRYSFGQLTTQQVTEAGMFDVNREYRQATEAVFAMSPNTSNGKWQDAELRLLPIAYRNDGFSPFYRKPPLAREDVQKLFVDPMAGSNVKYLVWGLGPGSVFCFDTKVGQVFGDGLTEEQRALLREGDLWVHENVRSLIDAGHCPLTVAVERGHELGFKVLARLEMNHEYGPADPGNWMWVAFVGDLNKEHPEYRIGKSVLLDFKHKEVRDFKLAILREAVEAGADGISMDFAVYPPFFAEPDCDTMTRFVRDVRTMLNEVGKRQNRYLTLMTRVPNVEVDRLGLDWKTWMRQGLIDIIVPTHLRPADYFDIRIEEFVQVGRETGIPVMPTIWQALGFVTTDQSPGDKEKGVRRYDKPKTRGMYYAQALMLHRAGADGIQLGMSENQWNSCPWFDDLADPRKLAYADKHYMVDPISLRPGTFEVGHDGPPFRAEKRAGLRLGDDIPAALQAGKGVQTTLVLYVRPLREGESLEVTINGHGPVSISGDSEQERALAAEAPIDTRKEAHEGFIFEKDWWRHGEHRLPTEPSWWRLQDNELRFVYFTRSRQVEPPLTMHWVDLLVSYGDGGE